MAMVTLTSSSKTNLLKKSDDNNHRGDASFSSYLNSAVENSVTQLAESNKSLSHVVSQEEQYSLGKKKVEGEEEEIGVFGAEKYFNGAMDDSPRIPKIGNRKHKYTKDEQIKVVAPVKTRLQPGTPSVRSESSWNSQSALLQSVLRNSSRKQANKVQGKSFFAGLRCKCSCADKDSVDIDEHNGENSFRKTASCSSVQEKSIVKEPINATNVINKVHIDKPGFAKEDFLLNEGNCFNLPTVTCTTKNLPIKGHFEEEEEIKPRKSIEVFRCPVMETRDKSPAPGRRLSMFSWDADQRLDKSEFSATPGESYTDAMSDASSDLFEIESLTGKAHPFLARQGSDATSDCATPTAYAPSEASIEWSVEKVTASAADFSVTSDYEELRASTRATSPVKTFLPTSNAKTRAITEINKRRPNISSLGCKSHKSVRIAGDT